MLRALIHWRFVLSVLGAVALAVVISSVFPSFAAEYCLGLVIFGIAFGGYWQARTDASIALAQDVTEPKISAPIAFLGLGFLGLLSGGMLTAMFDSRLVGGVVLLLSTMFVMFWFKFLKHRTVRWRSAIFVAISLMFGFLLSLLPLFLGVR